MKNLRKIIILILVGLIAVSSLLMLASCKEEPKYPDRRVVEEDTTYQIDIDTSLIKGLPLLLIGNEEESYIKLRADGTATVKIMTNVDLSYANNLLGDLSSFSSSEIDAFISMIEAYLPGLDFADLSTVNTVFESTIGLTIHGLDPNNAELQAIFTHIATKRTLPDKIEFPKGSILGLEINGPYYIKDVYSEHLGITRTGIFMGRHHDDGEAFLIMELVNTEDGGQRISLDYQALDFHIYAEK